MEILSCPICNDKLLKKERYFECLKGHRFDLSKSGYVNLHISQKKKEKQHGDDAAMILARRLFLEKGYYNPLMNQVAETIKGRHVLVDCGCGEGYYTEHLSQGVDKTYGIDISKDAIEKAAKKYSDITFIVGSTYHLPILDHQVDALTSIFAPFSVSEVGRVLNDEGIFVHVFPLERHLIEMKSVLYETPYLNDNEIGLFEGLTLDHHQALEFTIELPNQEDIHALYSMTPYYHRTPQSGVERLSQLDQLSLTCHFGISIYKKEMELK